MAISHASADRLEGVCHLWLPSKVFKENWREEVCYKPDLLFQVQLFLEMPLAGDHSCGNCFHCIKKKKKSYASVSNEHSQLSQPPAVKEFDFTYHKWSFGPLMIKHELNYRPI